jgi:hypothetical protein
MTADDELTERRIVALFGLICLALDRSALTANSDLIGLPQRLIQTRGITGANRAQTYEPSLWLRLCRDDLKRTSRKRSAGDLQVRPDHGFVPACAEPAITLKVAIP